MQSTAIKKAYEVNTKVVKDGTKITDAIKESIRVKPANAGERVAQSARAALAKHEAEMAGKAVAGEAGAADAAVTGKAAAGVLTPELASGLEAGAVLKAGLYQGGMAAGKIAAPIGAAISAVTTGVGDFSKVRKGQMSANDAIADTTVQAGVGAASAFAGGFAGAEAGALIGTAAIPIPIVGTLVGGAVGLAAGVIVGAGVTKVLNDTVAKPLTKAVSTGLHNVEGGAKDVGKAIEGLFGG